MTVLVCEELVLCETSLPALAPLANQDAEYAPVKFQGLVEATIEIIEAHLVLGFVRQQEAQVAGNCKKQIVVEGWKIGQLVSQTLGNRS